MPTIPVPGRYYEKYPDGAVSCRLCPHGCFLRNSNIGICGARKNRDGTLYALTYGAVTSSALDPIEKKPLYHYFPGSRVFSIGGWGCNLKCVFCQNAPISQYESPSVSMSPLEIALEGMAHSSIGVAYTYNEPLIAMEYVIDCARAVHKRGGKNVVVTNGFIEPGPLADLLPHVDAMNIDVKAFNNRFYKKMCGGTLDPVLKTVKSAVGKVHVELTTLLIPNENDAVPEMEDLACWVADNCGKQTPVHLTAYHPSYNYNAAATTVAHLKNAWRIFRSRLDYVYMGNVSVPGAGDTMCVHCGKVVLARIGYKVDSSGMNPDGTCANCGTPNNIVVT